MSSGDFPSPYTFLSNLQKLGQSINRRYQNINQENSSSSNQIIINLQNSTVYPAVSTNRTKIQNGSTPLINVTRIIKNNNEHLNNDQSTNPHNILTQIDLRNLDRTRKTTSTYGMGGPGIGSGFPPHTNISENIVTTSVFVVMILIFIGVLLIACCKVLIGCTARNLFSSSRRNNANMIYAINGGILRGGREGGSNSDNNSGNGTNGGRGRGRNRNGQNGQGGSNNHGCDALPPTYDELSIYSLPPAYDENIHKREIKNGENEEIKSQAPNDRVEIIITDPNVQKDPNSGETDPLGLVSDQLKNSNSKERTRRKSDSITELEARGVENFGFQSLSDSEPHNLTSRDDHEQNADIQRDKRNQSPDLSDTVTGGR